jgi:hypothetical protein
MKVKILLLLLYPVTLLFNSCPLLSYICHTICHTVVTLLSHCCQYKGEVWCADAHQYFSLFTVYTHTQTPAINT